MTQTDNNSFFPVLALGLALMILPFVVGFVLIGIDTYQRLAR